MAASLRTERLGLHDDEVDIGIDAMVAPPAGAEEDDLFRIDLVDYRVDHPVEEIIRDRCHCSTSRSRFSSPTVISFSIASTCRIRSAGSSSGTGSATRGL